MKHESRITLPSGVSEDDFLGLIEGELPPERGALVRAKIATAGGIAARLADEFEQDRRALAGMATDPAPTGLIRATMTRLAKEHDAAMRSASLPVSKVIPDGRRSVLARLFAGERGRRLALAAGVLLSAGVGVWGIGLIVSGLWPQRTTTIARVDVEGPVHSDDSMRAIALGLPEDAALPENDSTGAAVLAAAEQDGPVFTEASLSDMLSVPSVRAAALAAEGRLALTVRVVSAREALAKVEAVGRDHGAPFRLGPRMFASELPPAMAALATPSELPWDDVSIRSRPAGPVLASEGAGRFAPSMVRRTEPGGGGGAGVRAIYRASIAPQADALADLRERVAAAVGASSEDASVLTLVFYRELPASLAEPPVPTAAEVLWWSQPAGRWAKRVSVPVVIEE